MKRAIYSTDDEQIRKVSRSSNVVEDSDSESEVIDLTESGMIYLNANCRSK